MTKRSLFTTIICMLLATGTLPLSAQSYSAAERGIAVYYADYLEGQPTAYGELYRRNELTAAHRSHPAGTLLKVTRLDNKRSVVVRVNDRGAFCDGCVVDISRAAAEQIDLIRDGRAMVSVDVVGRQGGPVTADSRFDRNSIALYQGPAYTNTHSTYPRPDAGFQSGNTYAKSAPSTYSDPQPIRINVTPSPSTSTAQQFRNQEIRSKGLNAYNQIEAFDSYNYYQAQQAERRAVNNTASTEAETYERLRARGLLPEEDVSSSSAARPSSYDQTLGSNVTAKGAPNPSAYIRYDNAQNSRITPQAYNTVASAPTQFTARSPVSNISEKGSFAIQFASYRNFDNAQRQLQKLRQLGMTTAYLLETDYKGDKLYKVLNGPYADKQTAGVELGRFKSNLRVDGIVILLK